MLSAVNLMMIASVRFKRQEPGKSLGIGICATAQSWTIQRPHLNKQHLHLQNFPGASCEFPLVPATALSPALAASAGLAICQGDQRTSQASL
jgi:hypothetical protein